MAARIVGADAVFFAQGDLVEACREWHLRELVAAGAAPKGWAGRWGTGEAARRILWQWEAFGAVTRDGRDGAAK